LEHAIVIELVKEVRSRMPRIGTPKLSYILSDQFRQHDIKMGRAGLNDLLAANGMLVRQKKRKPKTTNSNHRYRRYQNLIKDLPIIRPEQVWVCDITYITVEDRFAYLSIITDAYSRMILGYNLCPTLESKGAITALQMALGSWDCSSGQLIHHSDRGVQYCCDDYTAILISLGISISMTQKGDPYENAIAERVNGILKSEFGLGSALKSFEEARILVDKSIEIYNKERPHASCDYLIPEKAHQTTGILKRRWKNYYKPQKSDKTELT
jgi:putative transposase